MGNSRLFPVSFHSDNGGVLTYATPTAAQLVDEAILVLEQSITRGGWFGPARNAFDALGEGFRTRLVVLSCQLRAPG